MLTILFKVITALPTVLKLVEYFIAQYEKGVESNKRALLEKADDDVTKFVTRVSASNRVREDGVSGIKEANATSANNQCDCSGTGLCARCIENHK